MKKYTIIIMIILLLTSNFSAFGAETDTQWNYKDITHEEITIGAQSGEVYGDIAASAFKKSNIVFFTTGNDMLAALNNGKIDAVIVDSSFCKPIEKEGLYPNFEYHYLPDEFYSNKSAPIFATTALRDQYNEWFYEMRDSGAWQEICDFWLSGKLPEYEDIPKLEFTGENGTLTLVETGNFPPLSYIVNDGELTGFDYDFMARFVQSLGMDMDVKLMSYDAILPYILSGKADGSLCSFTVTEERQESVYFGEPCIITQAVLIMKKDAGEGAGVKLSPVQWLKAGIEKNLITENRWKMIVDGLGITVQISLLSLVLGTLLGCLVCFLLMRKSRIVSGIARFYCGLIHGLPMVVLLMISYYIVFAKSNISPVFIAVAAFSLVEAAIIGGSFKTAISTVDTVEIEAARSMGYASIGAFRRVTMPQAFKVALPGYLDGFVELVKSTAIVGYIAIQDLSRAGDLIRSRTYDAYFPLLLTAVIYLFITIFFVQLIKFVIRRVQK